MSFDPGLMSEVTRAGGTDFLGQLHDGNLSPDLSPAVTTASPGLPGAGKESLKLKRSLSPAVWGFVVCCWAYLMNFYGS